MSSTPVVPFSVLYGLLPDLIKRAKQLGLPPTSVIPPEEHSGYEPGAFELLKNRYQQITGEAWAPPDVNQIADNLGGMPDLHPAAREVLEQFMVARANSRTRSTESEWSGNLGDQLDAALEKLATGQDPDSQLVVIRGKPPVHVVAIAMPAMLKSASKWGFPDALVIPPKGMYSEEDRTRLKEHYARLTGKTWRQPTKAEISRQLTELKASPDAIPKAVDLLQEALDTYVPETEDTGSEETVTASAGQNQDELIREIRSVVRHGKMPPVADVLRYMPTLIRGAQKKGIPEELILPWKDDVYTPAEYDVLRDEFKKLTGRVWTFPAKHDLLAAIGDLKLDPSANPDAILAITEVLNEMYPEEAGSAPVTEEEPENTCGCASCAPPNDQLSKEMVTALEAGMEEVNTLLLALFDQVGDNIVGVTLPKHDNRVTKPFTPGTPDRDYVTIEADRDDFNKLTLVFQSVPRYGQIRVAYDGTDLQWTVSEETDDGVPVLVGAAVDYLVTLVGDPGFSKKFHGLIGLLLVNEKK